MYYVFFEVRTGLNFELKRVNDFSMVHNYRCEQLYCLMKNGKSRTRTRLTDEHLEGCMRIATTEIRHYIEGLTN
jgi:hypothetical protein